MTNEEKMTIDERYKYLRTMQGHYQQASPQERSDLLDEMERVTDLHRKSLIRLMKNKPKRHQRRQQRERSYKAEVEVSPDTIENPWLAKAGMFVDDPTWDDFLKAMTDYRQQLD
jgi:hypothetical protein